MSDLSFPGLLSSDSNGNSGTGAFGLPSGLLDPALNSYANRQALMGLAQGLLKAGAPSYMPKSFGSVAADVGGGLMSGEQSGVDNALKLQQVMMQRAGMGATYQALVSKVGPQAALLYTMHPELLASQIKPQALQPGGTLVAPLSLGPSGSGSADAGGVPAAGAAASPQGATVSAPAAFAQGPGGSPAAPAQDGGIQGNVIASNTNGLLGPDALANMVQQRLLGDTSPEKSGAFGGMGPLGKLNNARYQAALSASMQQQQITPAELSRRTANFPSYSKGVGDLTDMQVRMGTARNEFQNLWPQFVAQVQKVNGGALGNFPKFNQVRQYIQEHKGDPDVVQLDNYLTGLENQYVRAVSTSRAGPTVNDHQNFEGMINKYWNPAQIQSTGAALNNEMDAARQSIPQMKTELAQEYGLAPKSAPPSGAPRTATNPKTGERMMWQNGKWAPLQ